jgi:ABC-2 type transport system ATP-binding protein
MTPVLSLQKLTVRFGDSVAVDGLTLEVSRGEAFALLGPNGSGKSSTLAAVMGEVAPAAGEVRVEGLRAADAPLAYRHRVGLVPQELAFYDELSPRENLTFFGKLYGLRGATLARRVAEALDHVCLSDVADRPAGACSGGMQRRLNLTCALLHQPALLLLDEPTVGLDLPSREAVFQILRRLRRQGTAIVYTTHYLEEAEQLCDRIGILDRGRLIALGTLAELADLTRVEGPGPIVRAHGPHGLPPPRSWRLESVYGQLTGGSSRSR